jgi:hypothetical protein
LGEIRGEAKIPAFQSRGFKTEDEEESSGMGYETWSGFHGKELVAKFSDLSDETWIRCKDVRRRGMLAVIVSRINESLKEVEKLYFYDYNWRYWKKPK